ncbi:hypothetical protein [Methylacidimicrobium tartarophylax]|uniref:hypothetical protein n=1 Tax=Methylacidimicrobium tartarophylax TaxID=1041768 RepID=UPI0015B40AAA|nr:hypothetical protein [Methylacidimicrobium tartarophylax]
MPHFPLPESSEHFWPEQAGVAQAGREYEMPVASNNAQRAIFFIVKNLADGVIKINRIL